MNFFSQMLSDLRTLQSICRELLTLAERESQSLRSGQTESMGEASQWLAENFMKDPRLPAAGAVPYLMGAGYLLGGWQMARAAIIAQKKLASSAGDTEFYRAKLGTARFYCEHILPKARSLSFEVTHGAESVFVLSEAQF